jgi:uncharacterized protein
MADTVVHEPENHRYVLKRGDQELGEAVYVDGERGEIVFTHTEIDRALQEKGLGSALAKGALDDVRATTDRKVVAQCPFIFRYISEHDEYQDLTSR